MSDARWVEIFDDVDAALMHFQNAIAIHEEDEMDDEGLQGYKACMAFMHAMQSGHTSLEKSLLRILTILGEEKPSGESWHKDLIRRVSREVLGRPPILDASVAKAADETRSFRNVATRSYDTFEFESSAPAVAAARVLVASLRKAIEDFKDIIDPPDPNEPNSTP